MGPPIAPPTPPETVLEAGRLGALRRAQARWAQTPMAQRRARVRAARGLLVARAQALAGAADRLGPQAGAETLAAEILPLAQALRFLERRAGRILRPRKAGGAARRIRILREPHGVVLVIAPGNYPLFLPGVQLAQALVAGNAVLLKPAPRHLRAARALRALFIDAGFDPDLVAVTGETPQSAQAAIAEGVDHVVLTGSADTGRAVLRTLAPKLTSATMELGGCDAVFVRPDADLDLVARALRFGLSFNGSRTCIAPRRVFVPGGLVEPLVARLAERLADVEPTALGPSERAAVRSLVHAACDQGARTAVGTLPEVSGMRPIVLAGVRPEMEIAGTDVFAPVLSLLEVRDDEDALRQAAVCPYALGATVFGSSRGAQRLAERVQAGVVVVNDMIAPTADPHVSFGGRGDSGFGVTRGPGGLLAMTVPKTVILGRGRRKRHLDALRGGEDRLFLAWLRAAHAPGWRARLGALRNLMKEGARYARSARGGKEQGDEADA